jgi:hypothetical protein
MRKFTLTLFTALFFSGLLAQQNNFWTTVNESAVGKNLFANSRRPAAYKLFQLNDANFKQHLSAAPSEKTVSANNSSFIVSFPNAAGQLEQYRVVEAPVMHPDLAARYPGINSYAGKGIEDPSSTVRFDVSSQGVHAMILSAKRATIYIDPLDGNYYRVVSRNDVTDYHNEFRCLTEDVVNADDPLTARPMDADDGKLRTYRLALISGGEFSQHWLNGTEPDDAARRTKVLIAQNSHITRANAVFERDFGVRLVLVANNDAVIFLDPATDPFPSPSSPSNATVQNTNDNFIGSANYDIGHLESKGSDNGNAGCIGCVCTAGQKGKGWTVYSNPSLLEFFVIDYLTHEMGHQMGGNHTFTFADEGTTAQVEPGSGVTIMGYAGITGSTDVQPHSDEYFHSKSIEQVSNYLKSAAGSCAVETVTGNTAPVANAGADYIIPKSTPFKLTGTGSDPDAGDVLSYNWEQTNPRGPGFSTFPTPTATAGPQFRPYLPTTSLSRTVPEINSILNGVNGNQWEALPSVARTLNFRFIVKDNHPGGGNNKSDNMVLNISGTTGPFGVSFPNTPVTWTANTPETVTWTVNGTDGTPINCSNVNILLSTDGGFTFPVTVVANTLNDGSEVINVPNNPGTTCRIKVEAVGNIFFDISNTNFTINVPASGYDFNNPAAASIVCASATTSAITLGTAFTGGYNTPINLSASGVPAGTTVTFGTNPVIPGGSSVVTLNNVNTLAYGSYNITITGVSGTITRTRVLTYTVQPGTGPTISVQPASQSICGGSNVTFNVTAPGALSYQWHLSTNGGSTFTAISGSNSSSYTVNAVTVAQNTYQYRVVVNGQCNFTLSNAAVLTVLTAPAISAHPQTVTLCLGSNNTFTSTASGSSITYQWQVSTNGGTSFSDIAGAVSSSYALTGITTAMNSNQYRVVVSGVCTPAATSNAAVLTVISPVAITTQPANVTICETGNVSFTVAGSGAGVLYQWQVSTDGGTNYTTITGATAATLNVNAVTAAMNNNRYRALLSNPTCTAPTQSNAAVLTVNARPTVTLAAAPLTVLLPGQSTTITATIVPSATGFNISWFKNNVLIPGVTGTTYVVDSVEIGGYRVDIVNQVTGCNNQSNVLTIGTTPSEKLFIFPTPNSGQFTVSYFNSAGTSTQRSVTVFDAHGAKKYNGKFAVTGPYTLLNINLRPAAAGIYVVVIGDATGKKLIESKVMVY